MALNKTKKWTGSVNRETLPVRKQPNAKAEECSFSPLPNKTKVNVCDTKSGWHYIEVDGKYGYVSAKYIKYTEATRPTPSKVVKWVGKTTEAVTGKDWASKYGKTIETIPKGASVSVCDTLNGYYYVRYGTKYEFIAQGKVKYVSEPVKADDKVKTFLKAVKDTQEYARTHGYIYADSQSTVPTADKKISCDRLVAKALWDMGYTDQPKGGIALGRGIEDWLIKHGFKKSTSMSAAKAGSIMIVMNPSGSSRHVFVIASRNGNTYTRYDCGSNSWIKSKQPLAGLWMSQLLGVYNFS